MFVAQRRSFDHRTIVIKCLYHWRELLPCPVPSPAPECSCCQSIPCRLSRSQRIPCRLRRALASPAPPAAALGGTQTQVTQARAPLSGQRMFPGAEDAPRALLSLFAPASWTPRAPSGRQGCPRWIRPALGPALRSAQPAPQALELSCRQSHKQHLDLFPQDLIS